MEGNIIKTHTLTKVRFFGLCLAIVFGLLFFTSPKRAFAASSCGTYGMSGSGTTNDPCTINDCNQLFDWATTQDGASMARSYALTATINCSGEMSTTPIGTVSLAFTGTFEGQGNTIQHLYVDNGSSDDVGLFGFTDGATISNISIGDGFLYGGHNVGALVGTASNGTKISNAHASGFSMTTAGNGSGLVGTLDHSTLTRSSATNNQVGNEPYSTYGGLVGTVTGDGSVAVSDSFVSDTPVVGNDTIGGLIGYLENAEINNVYARVTVTQSGGGYSGGLVGKMNNATIRSAYAQGSERDNYSSTGGLVGGTTGPVSTISNSFSAVSRFGPVGGPSMGSLYGSAENSPTLDNNWYDTTVLSNGCFTGHGGGATGCTPTTGSGSSADYWLNPANEPIASWDTFSTWNIGANDGSHYPILFAINVQAPTTFDGGDGTSEYPYQISSCRQLQLMNDSYSSHYKLTGDVDCAETVNWFDGKGFDPVGDNDTPFTGSIDGQHYTISNLTIIRANDTPDQQPGDEEFVGLFGKLSNATVTDLNIVTSKVKGYLYVGGIAGYALNSTLDTVNVNAGTETNSCGVGGHCVWARFGQYGGGVVGYLDDSWVTNAETAGPVKGSGITIGGIAGMAANGSLISNSTTSSHIDGGEDIGGIVGLLDDSTLDTVSTSGEVIAQTDFDKAGYRAGGIAGRATNATIINATTSSHVTGYEYIGGLIGIVENSEISLSSSLGNVEGTDYVGGFVGQSNTSSFQTDVANGETVTGYGGSTGGFAGGAYCDTLFTDSTAAAEVSGWSNTGGFAGSDGCEGFGARYEHVAALGNVYGNFNTGGLVGSGSVSTISNSYAQGDVIGTTNSGGLVGSAWGFDPNEETYPMLIDQSFAVGNVTSTNNSDVSGGLVGYMDATRIQDSYARGAITDLISSSLVGISHNGLIVRSYATGLVDTTESVDSGLVGAAMDGTIVQDSFWDNETTGIVQGNVTDDSAGAGLVTADLQNNDILTDAGWDLDTIWGFNSGLNDAYACLRWQNDACPAQQASIELTSAQNNASIFLSESGCSNIDTAESVKESGLAKQDVAYSYPAGLLNYTFSGCNLGVATVTITIVGDYDPAKVTLRKYNPATQTYTTIDPASDDASVSRVTFFDGSALQITYNINDGGPLDTDGAVNGMISDPIGPGLIQVEAPNTGLGNRR